MAAPPTHSLNSSQSSGSFDWDKNCPDLIQCAKNVGDATGITYILPSRANEVKLSQIPGAKFSNEKLSSVFSKILHSSSYTRVPTKLKNVYEVVSSRNVRNYALPIFRASRNESPNWPQNWDYVTLVYQAKDLKKSKWARYIQDLLNRNGRVIDPPQGSLVLVGSVPELQRAEKILRDWDGSSHRNAKTSGKVRRRKNRRRFNRRPKSEAALMKRKHRSNLSESLEVSYWKGDMSNLDRLPQ